MNRRLLSFDIDINATPKAQIERDTNGLRFGVVYAIGFGLFAAGVSVTSHFTRLLPRWLTLLGIVLAITGELSWFSLIAFPANFFIPITRYVGFIWMLLAAIWLTRGRNAKPASAG